MRVGTGLISTWKRKRDNIKDWTGLNMKSAVEKTSSRIGLVSTWKALERRRQGWDWSQHGKRWKDHAKDWTGLNMENAGETTSRTGLVSTW